MPRKVSRKILRKILTALEGHQPLPARPVPCRSVLDALAYSVLRAGEAPARGARAFGILHRTFVDWNEVRVTAAEELADTLAPVGYRDLPERIRLLKDSLDRLSRTQSSKSLDALRAEGAEQAGSQVARLFGPNSRARADVLMYVLEADRVPVSQDLFRMLRRIGIARPSDRPAAMESWMSTVVLPAEAGRCYGLLTRHADTVCRTHTQGCPQCAIHGWCVEGRRRLRNSGSRQGRASLARRAPRTAARSEMSHVGS